jgi:hypothetical protein
MPRCPYASSITLNMFFLTLVDCCNLCILGRKNFTRRGNVLNNPPQAMKRITQIGVALVVLLCAAGNPIHVLAVGEEQKNVMILEVSPEASDSASKEYLLIYNPNDTVVNAAGWLVQYRSASYKSDDTKGWSARAILGCQSTKQTDCSTPHDVLIAPGGLIRLSSYETGDGILPLASGMATTGGVLRLQQPDSGLGLAIVHDKVGYGTASDFEGSAAAPQPAAGRSILRLQDEAELYVDTDRNDSDFTLQPKEEDEQSSDEPTTTTPAPEDPGQGTVPIGYLDVEISEVMPDPASPQTDSADEFIELYNPHAESVNMGGYVLKTGTNWNYKYVLPDIMLSAHEYLVLSSSQTHLTLSNSGSGVQLFDPTGKLLYEAPTYGKAKPGQSWTRDAQGVWVWTTKPTPDAQNIVEIVTAAKAAAPAKKPASAKAPSAKKPATPKVAKTSAVKGVSATAAQPTQAQSEGNQAGMWALGAAIVLGLGYAIFEYRQDIAGFVRRRFETVRGLFRK